MNNDDATLYSLQLRLVKEMPDEPAGQRVELTALPEGPGEPVRLTSIIGTCCHSAFPQ